MLSHEEISNLFSPYMNLDLSILWSTFKPKLIGNYGTHIMFLKYSQNYILFIQPTLSKEDIIEIDTRWKNMNNNEKSPYPYYYGLTYVDNDKPNFVCGVNVIDKIMDSSLIMETDQYFEVANTPYCGYLPIAADKFD